MVCRELCAQGVAENDFKDAESFVEATRYGEVPFVEAKRLVELAVRRSEVGHEPLSRERDGDTCRVRLVHNHCRTSCGSLTIEDPGRPLREQVSGVTACSGYPSPPTVRAGLARAPRASAVSVVVKGVYAAHDRFELCRCAITLVRRGLRSSRQPSG